MRVKGYPDHEKEPKIAAFYAEKEEKKKARLGSSEDVWDLRTVPVERAFWRDPDKAPVEAEGLGGKIGSGG